MNELANLTQRVISWGGQEGFATSIALYSDHGYEISYAELADQISVECGTHQGIEFVVASMSHEFVVTYLRLAHHAISQLLIAEDASVDFVNSLIRAYKPVALHAPRSFFEKMNGDWNPDAFVGDYLRLEFSHFETINQQYEGQVLLLTSGSTGLPRAVRLSQRNLSSNAADISQCLGLASSDVTLANLPLSYTFGLSLIHSSLWSGAASVLSPMSPLQAGFKQLLTRYNISCIAGVPFSYSMFQRIGLMESPPRGLVKFLQAGGKLDAASVQEISRKLTLADSSFYVMYGQTEATARMTVLPPDLAADFPDSVGFSVPSGRLSIGTDDHSDEIVFAGPNVMLGYAQSISDLGAPDLLSGTLKTGDLGTLENGLLRIHGRAKRIVKISGVRLSLDQIEQRLGSLGEVAVTKESELVLIGFVETSKSTAEKIKTILQKEFGLRKSEYRLKQLGEIPRFGSGKINYTELGSHIAN